MLRIRRLCAGHRSRRHCGAKHAIQGFHEALRCELLHDHTNLHVTMVQMPAINPPQFSWVLSRLCKHAQPVPPIYQPEFAARAVVYAAEHPAGVSTGSAPPPPARSSPTPSLLDCSIAIWPAPGSSPSKPTGGRPRTPRRTCSNRPTDAGAGTSAPTGSSATSRTTTTLNCGCPSITARWPPPAVWRPESVPSWGVGRADDHRIDELPAVDSRLGQAAVSAAVDMTHEVSMALLSVIEPRFPRPALISGTVSLGTSVLSGVAAACPAKSRPR